MKSWTFGSKIVASLATTTAFAVIMGGVGIATVRAVADHASHGDERLAAVEQVHSAAETEMEHMTRYVITSDQGALEHSRSARGEVSSGLRILREMELD